MANNIAFKDLHTGEIQEIIGRAPAWPVKRGMQLIGLIIVMLLAAAGFIKYPEVVSAPVTLISSTPPIEIGQTSQFNQLRLVIHEGDKVSVGQTIAYWTDLADEKKTDTTGKFNEEGTNKILSASSKRRVIVSPVSGTLEALDDYRNQNYLSPASASQHLVIVPEVKNYTAVLHLPVSGNSSKVKPGQDVKIKLKEFTFREYGFIKAKVAYVSDLSLSGTYLVRLNLSNDLSKIKNKPFYGRPQLEGTAEIIIKDRSVLERLIF